MSVDEAMERYADGEDAAFAALYDELAPRLRRFALRHAGSRALADDVIQQTLLQIHLCRARFVRRARVLPWAYAIALNALRDLARRGAREARVARASELEDQAAPGADEALEDKERALALASELRRMPEKLRAAFLLVNVEGLSVADAAAVLGVTAVNVKVRAWRARQLLLRAEALAQGGAVAPTR